MVYVFTYNESGAQQWFYGVGETTENSIQIEQLNTTEGGVFGIDFDASLVNNIEAGTLKMTFNGCHSGMASYVINGTASGQSLSRLTEIKDTACSSQISTTGTSNSINQSGSWINTDHNGEGFIVQVLSGDLA